MKISQLIHAMGRDHELVIDDFDAPIDKMRIFVGTPRKIKKDDPINKMHVMNICADGDVILVLARKQRKKREEKRYERLEENKASCTAHS